MDEAVVWDQILPHDGSARVSVQAHPAEYLLRDPAFSLLDNDVVLTLSYDVTPHLGLFRRGVNVAHSEVVRLPSAFATPGGEVRSDVDPLSIVQTQ